MSLPELADIDATRVSLEARHHMMSLAAALKMSIRLPMAQTSALRVGSVVVMCGEDMVVVAQAADSITLSPATWLDRLRAWARAMWMRAGGVR